MSGVTTIHLNVTIFTHNCCSFSSARGSVSGVLPLKVKNVSASKYNLLLTQKTWHVKWPPLNFKNLV